MGFAAPWGRNLPLWLLAFTTACTTVQAVVIIALRALLPPLLLSLFAPTDRLAIAAANALVPGEHCGGIMHTPYCG